MLKTKSSTRPPSRATDWARTPAGPGRTSVWVSSGTNRWQAATARSLVSMITAFNAQIAAIEEQVSACFGQALDAEIYLSQPGLGQVLAARVLGEFGDDPYRYATARNRKNYVATSPISRASGKK